MKIAVLNAGSSSLKCKIFKYPEKELLFSMVVEKTMFKSVSDFYLEAINELDIDFNSMDIVAHRVVHGGEKFKKATLINSDIINTLKTLIPLAPIHNSANIKCIETSIKQAPNIPQIAIFDTAFHATMKKEAYLYALPYRLYKQNNIRKYGFHGSSHSYLLKETAKILKKNISEINIITLHLGNGSSVCAIKNGVSIDTSMGFTPLEGLVMGSRCGDIDPAIVVYLQRELGYSFDEVDNLLNNSSGLLGLCGNSDVRKILNAVDEKSKIAIDIMVRRIQKYIGSYMILLENIDAIVFSGGIGENSEYIRKRIIDNVFIKNIKCFVINTDEELEIANEAFAFIKKL